jgi:hypothetical protein
VNFNRFKVKHNIAVAQGQVTLQQPRNLTAFIRLRLNTLQLAAGSFILI